MKKYQFLLIICLLLSANAMLIDSEILRIAYSLVSIIFAFFGGYYLYEDK